MSGSHARALLMSSFAFAAVACSAARAEGDLPRAGQSPPRELEWADNPAVPPGGKVAVLAGRPAQPGPYRFRLKFPADHKVMPHSHPDDRTYTVVAGTWYIGLGDRFDPEELKAFPPGSVYVVPARASHFHWARSGESIVEVTGVGPTATDYVNPADDPRKR